MPETGRTKLIWICNMCDTPSDRKHNMIRHLSSVHKIINNFEDNMIIKDKNNFINSTKLPSNLSNTTIISSNNKQNINIKKKINNNQIIKNTQTDNSQTDNRTLIEQNMKLIEQNMKLIEQNIKLNEQL